MYIRKKHAENARIKRPNKKIKNYDTIFSSKYGVYLKLAIMWSLFFLIDFLLDFRIEAFWSCWLMCRSVNETYRYQGLIFTLFFILTVVTSDLICFLLIPTKCLFFLGCTYVWIQLLGMADRSISPFTVGSCVFFVYIEFTFRLRQVSKNLSFTLNICRPFAAHCIGYPVVTMCFQLKNYVSHKFRLRRQTEVRRINQFYYELLEKAIPEELRQYSYVPDNDRASVPDSVAENSSSTTSSSQGNKQEVAVTHSNSGGGSVNKTVVLKKKEVLSANSSALVVSSGQLPSHQTNGRVKHQKPNHQLPDVVMDSSSNHSQQHPVSSQSPVILSHSIHAFLSTLPSCPSSGSDLQPSTVTSNDHHSTQLHPTINSSVVTDLSATNHLLEDHQPGPNKVQHQQQKCKRKPASTPVINGNIHESSDKLHCESTKNSRDDAISKFEIQLRRLRSELTQQRKSESELRNQVQQSSSAEAALRSETRQARVEVQAMQTRLSSLTDRAAREKQACQTMERRLAEEKNARLGLTARLEQERRQRLEDGEERQRAIQSAVDAAARSADCCELCRKQRRELESELAALRREVPATEERVTTLLAQTVEHAALALSAGEVRELSGRICALKDENLHLTEQLRELNKMKQELLTSYHSSQLEIKDLDYILKRKNYQIMELQSRLEELGQQQQLYMNSGGSPYAVTSSASTPPPQSSAVSTMPSSPFYHHTNASASSVANSVVYSHQQQQQQQHNGSQRLSSNSPLYMQH